MATSSRSSLPFGGMLRARVWPVGGARRGLELLALRLNPLFVREMRGRGRSWPFRLALLGCALTLSFIAMRASQEIAALYAVATPTEAESLLPTGRFILGKLMMWQMIACLFAPFLTVTAIAGERERGLLQPLLMSRLKAREIAWGKWCAALGLCGPMLLVALPIDLWAWAQGGVAGGELVAALALQVSTIALGTAWGLWCSTQFRRSDSALLLALIPLVFFHGYSTYPLWSGDTVGGNLLGFAWLNPVVAVVALFSKPLHSSVAAPLIAAQMIFGLGAAWMLLSATVNRVEELIFGWEDAPEINTAWVETSSNSLLLSLLLPEAVKATRSEYPIPQVEQPAPKAECQQDAPAQPSWTQRLRFENPVLQREVRVRLRRSWIAELDPTAWLPIGMLSVIVAFVLQSFISNTYLNAYGTYGTRSFEWQASLIWAGVMMAGTAWAAASSFTRERDQNMLETLLLTPLSTGQIVRGKLSAALIVCAHHTLLIAPLVACCFLMLPVQTLCALPLALAAAVFGGAIGMWFSWICRQTSIATGGALAMLLALTSWTAFVLPDLLHKTLAGRALVNFWDSLTFIPAAQMLLTSAVLSVLSLAMLALLHAVVGEMRRRESGLKAQR